MVGNPNKQLQRNPLVNKMTDEQIMKMVRDGDLGKSSVLFERYKLPMYNFFLRMTYHQSTSEDLTQSVFERMIRYRTTYQPDKVFRTWIYQIARNVKADHYRKNSKMAFANIEEQENSLASGSVMEVIEKREQSKTLEAAMAQLGEEQREVLLLTRYQKMKYADVANLLNCSEGAIKVKVHRAIKELRKVYLRLDNR